MLQMDGHVNDNKVVTSEEGQEGGSIGSPLAPAPGTSMFPYIPKKEGQSQQIFLESSNGGSAQRFSTSGTEVIIKSAKRSFDGS